MSFGVKHIYTHVILCFFYFLTYNILVFYLFAIKELFLKCIYNFAFFIFIFIFRTEIHMGDGKYYIINNST